MASANDKDTVYIDIDDEITGVIDKVKASSGKVVALVLPKRASVFQSIVNMKLLKRAADDAQKHLVLITSEAGLLPLAGAAGVHVAKTLTSKPEIPLGPQDDGDREEAVDEDEPQELTSATAGDRPVGELAAAAAAPPPLDNGVETLELDDDELPEDKAKQSADKSKAAPAAAAAAGKAAAKASKDKKLRIPNFNRFRLWLILGGLIVILLIIGIILALVVLPKATIDIKTDATSVPVSLDLNLSTSASQVQPNSGTVPAHVDQQQKTYTQQVPTTGQKNEGNKASGSITMSGQTCGSIPNGDPNDVPAGTGVSANGQTYITQQDTSFNYGGDPKHGCLTYQATSPTPIIAQNAGSSYNTPSGTSFSVAGRSELSATGSASGGTDNIVQTVNQNDIDNAKAKISVNDGAAKQSLENQLKGEGYYPIPATFSSGTPSVTPSTNVGDQASTVTVTETVTYTMFGAHKSDLKTLLDSNVQSQISGSQSLLDDGLSSARFSVINRSSTAAQITLTTNATAGPQLNINGIKQQAEGKKSGDVVSQLKNNPDVTNVTVNLSPFWVSSVPNKTSRITVNVAKPTRTVNQSNDGSP